MNTLLLVVKNNQSIGREMVCQVPYRQEEGTDDAVVISLGNTLQNRTATTTKTKSSETIRVSILHTVRVN